MPYIDKAIRSSLEEGRVPTKPGELNYMMSQLIRSYLSMKGVSLSYTVINDVIGVLECLKLELYRKLAGPYEDVKERENGSVW